MKKILIAILFLAVALSGNAEKKHLPEAKGLVGIWSLTTKLPNGQIVEVGNYKIINPDSTFYIMSLFRRNRQMQQTTAVRLYGTYSITSDSTYTERIVYELVTSFSADDSPRESLLKYKLLDENTLLILYKNEVIGKWVPEIWVRVQPIDIPKREKNI